MKRYSTTRLDAKCEQNAKFSYQILSLWMKQHLFKSRDLNEATVLIYWIGYNVALTTESSLFVCCFYNSLVFFNLI